MRSQASSFHGYRVFATCDAARIAHVIDALPVGGSRVYFVASESQRAIQDAWRLAIAVCAFAAVAGRDVIAQVVESPHTFVIVKSVERGIMTHLDEATYAGAAPQAIAGRN